MIEKVRRYFETLEGLSTEELDRSTERLVRAEKRNVAPVLTESNVEELLSDCAGMTKRDAEEYLVALRPKPVFAPSIRKTPSRPSFTSLPKTPAVQKTRRARPAFRTSPSILEPARPEVFNSRFAADRNFKEKFERLAEVLGVENSHQRMAEIMEQALDIALDKKDLKRKRERRLQRVSKGNKKSRPDKISAKFRYIPSEVRERVHDRAGQQCEYLGPDGTRCRSRTGLEIEHERPFALHRSHDERFLRLHCTPHNRLRAERVFGVAFIQEKIDASRRKPPPNGRADSS